MSIRPMVLMLASGLALTGCQPPAADNAAIANAAADAAADPVAQRMRALPPAQLRATLLRAILDGGQTCQGVVEAQEIAPVDGRPAWAAVCKETTRWLLVLGADGIIKVTGPVPAR